MTVFNKKLKFSTDTKVSFYDVTEDVKKILAESGVKNGIITVYSPHTTCSVLIQETSSGTSYNGNVYILQDLVEVLAKIVPTCTNENQYLHPGREVLEKHGIGQFSRNALNTDAHLRSVILGRSVTVPVIEGEIQLGQFGLIWFADFDQVRGREREAIVQVLGE